MCKNCCRYFNCNMADMPALVTEGIARLHWLTGKEYPVKIVSVRGVTKMACTKYLPDGEG